MTRHLPANAHSRILVVDDEATNVRLLTRLLERAGYTNLAIASDGVAALAEYTAREPDLVLLDLQMPRKDGYAVLEQLAQEAAGASVPVLVLTADSRAEARQHAERLGAHGFVLKPFDLQDVLHRVRLLLEVRAQACATFRQLSELREEPASGGGRDAGAELRALRRLGEACGFSESITEGHTRRVGELSMRIALELGLSPDDAESLLYAAQLHDLGKVAIPKEILFKPGPLTPDEMYRAQQHALIGALVLAGSRWPLLRLGAGIALTHHERWDGRGYPRGLARTEIPLAGRIVAVADVFDALTHERAYKDAWPMTAVLAEMEAGRGTRFDPDVVDALLRVLGRSSARRAHAA